MPKVDHRWGIKSPQGDISNIYWTGIRAKDVFLARQVHGSHSWEWYYECGWRCVKVWVYQEPRVREHYRTDYERLDAERRKNAK